MPTFCRHNRFVERCPICSKTLPGNEPAAPSRARPGSGAASRHREHGGVRPRGGVRVRREGRSAEDGYSSTLVPGLHASVDAERLASEIAFSNDRLAALALAPPGAYGAAVDAAAGGDFDDASWRCFLLAYLGPAEDDEPFAGVEAVLAVAPESGAVDATLGQLLDEVPRGPRSSHQPGSGARTLLAYADWASRTCGQAAGFTGDPGWTPERRFGRVFERLSLPGLSRAGRYELLVTLGRLGIYELSADALHLSASRPAAGEDATTVAAKRVLGIGDPLLLERRAATLARATASPLDALDLALFNWAAPQRATLGHRPAEEPASASVSAALGL